MSYFPDREFHLLYICQPKAGKRPRRSSQLISSLSESRTALSLPLMETHANLALHPASRHFMKLSTSCSKALRMCRGICFWRSLRKEDGGKWSGWGQSYNFSLNFMMQLVFFFSCLVEWFDEVSNFSCNLIDLDPGLFRISFFYQNIKIEAGAVSFNVSH